MHCRRGLHYRVTVTIEGVRTFSTVASAATVNNANIGPPHAKPSVFPVVDLSLVRVVDPSTPKTRHETPLTSLIYSRGSNVHFLHFHPGYLQMRATYQRAARSLPVTKSQACCMTKWKAHTHLSYEGLSPRRSPASSSSSTAAAPRLGRTEQRLIDIRATTHNPVFPRRS